MSLHGTVQLEDYERFVGPKTVERIKKKAEALRHLHVVHINSTYFDLFGSFEVVYRLKKKS